MVFPFLSNDRSILSFFLPGLQFFDFTGLALYHLRAPAPMPFNFRHEQATYRRTFI
jgi:hypothetical protein